MGTFGYFDKSFNHDFFVYYTNWSNYICMGLMAVSLVRTARRSGTQHDDKQVAPTFKFLCVIMILVTFFVYNILLTSGKTAGEYFGSLSNLLLHVILPILFVADWVLFYERGKLTWYHPLLCVVMPLIYVTFILIRGAILRGATNTVLYPYFFLNVAKLGLGGTLLWVLALVAVFVALGYLLLLFDRFAGRRNIAWRARSVA
jgi:hypothetical protein